MLKRKSPLKITAEEVIARREKRISDDFKNKGKKLSLLQEEVFSEQNDVNRLNNTKLELDNKILNEEEKLLRLREEIKKESKYLYSIEHNINSKKVEYSKLENKNTDLAYKTTMKIEDLYDIKCEHIRIKNDVINMKNKKQELFDEVSGIFDAIYKKNTELQNLSNTINKNTLNSASELSEIERAKFNSRKEASRINDVIKEKTEIIDGIKKEIDKNSRKKTRIERDLKEIDIKLSNKEEKNKDSVEILNKFLESKIKELKKLNTEFTDVNNKKDIVLQNSDKIEAEYNQKRLSFVNFSNQINSIKDEITFLEDKKNNDADTTAKENSRLGRQIKLKKEKFDELFGLVESKNKEMSNVKDKIAENENQLLVISGLIEKYKEAKETQEQEVFDLKSKSSSIKEDLDKSKNVLDKLISSKKEELMGIDASISDRKFKLSKLQTGYMNLNKTYKLLQNKMK